MAHHLIWRFVDREWFFRDDEDRKLYLRLLGNALLGSDWRCLAYALMSNHIHLAMVAGTSPMESWTRRVNPPFAQVMNKQCGRLGPMFAGRAHDYGFTSPREGGLLAYIHNNPVRAGVVSKARDSNWTSHPAYLGLVSRPPWLHVSEGLRRAGFSTSQDFDTLVETAPGERCDADVEKHRREVRRRGALEIGTPTLDGDMTRIALMAKPFAHIRPYPASVVCVVSNITEVPIERICSRRRIDSAASARRVIVRTGLDLGLTKSELAAALGISPQAVHVTSKRQLTDLEQQQWERATDTLRDAMWTRRHVA